MPLQVSLHKHFLHFLFFALCFSTPFVFSTLRLLHSLNFPSVFINYIRRVLTPHSAKVGGMRVRTRSRGETGGMAGAQAEEVPEVVEGQEGEDTVATGVSGYCRRSPLIL